MHPPTTKESEATNEITQISNPAAPKLTTGWQNYAVVVRLPRNSDAIRCDCVCQPVEN